MPKCARRHKESVWWIGGEVAIRTAVAGVLTATVPAASVLAATMIGAICWTGFSEEGVPYERNGAAFIVEDVGIAEDG